MIDREQNQHHSIELVFDSKNPDGYGLKMYIPWNKTAVDLHEAED